MSAIYLLDGKPHRLCDCDPVSNVCAQTKSGTRTLQTCGFSQCLVPAPDVMLAVSEIEPWIMTADRMPPHGEDVLFLTSSGRWLGWRRQEKGDWLDHFNDEPICADADVLCWMPVPATPEKLKVTHGQLRTITER